MLPAIPDHDQRLSAPYEEDDGAEVVCADCRATLSAEDAGVLLGVERCPECERRYALKAVIAVDFLGLPPADRLEIITAAMASLDALETDLRATLRRAAVSAEQDRAANEREALAWRLGREA